MSRALISYPCALSVKNYIISLPAKLKEQTERGIYEAYTAFCLQLISENTAKLSGGKAPFTSYADLISQKPHEKRSGDEIAANVISKLGLEVRYESS